MNDYIEMEAEVVEDLAAEVSRLRGQIRTLADFLMADFENETFEVKEDQAVGVAIHILGELRGRRRQVKALRAERRAMSAECLEEAKQLIGFVSHLNKGES